MWANRIILEDFVKHKPAREKIQSKLNELKVGDDCISDLHVSADAGYVIYRVTIKNNGLGLPGKTYTIFDNGNEI